MRYHQLLDRVLDADGFALLVPFDPSGMNTSDCIIRGDVRFALLHITEILRDIVGRTLAKSGVRFSTTPMQALSPDGHA